jgi:hypothetical protein
MVFVVPFDVIKAGAPFFDYFLFFREFARTKH